ncbi:MAG TPA: fluoride efflux transporter CrcB [Candidatus Polarisedimenticolia bacterium]|jgi:CrcB protein|nr:fluoride efflux transporter CrcB [Candidatus Polarisedimenticolia bacterium]
MLKSLWVGLGGFLGSTARYWLGGFLNRLSPQALFPYETLVINLSGCLGIGLLAGLAEFRGVLSPELRLFLLVGILGGFTTFSSFGYETFQLLRDGEIVSAGLNVTLHCVLGIVAVWGGYTLARFV